MKNTSQNFFGPKTSLKDIHPDFKILSDLFELLTLSAGDLVDVKDQFDWEKTGIEGDLDNDFLALQSYKNIDLTSKNSIWILEVLKYRAVEYDVIDNHLDLKYESSEDLKLDESFNFLIHFK